MVHTLYLIPLPPIPSLILHLKKGYTILCEMWTRSDPVVEGNIWKLRVISSDKDLPLCEGLEKEDEGEEDELEQKKNEEDEDKNKEEGAEGDGEKDGENVAEVAIGTEFHHKEVREYCLPDRDSVLFRYSLRAKTECPITAQLTTSKKDAFIKLEVSAMLRTYTCIIYPRRPYNTRLIVCIAKAAFFSPTSKRM